MIVLVKNLHSVRISEASEKPCQCTISERSLCRCGLVNNNDANSYCLQSDARVRLIEYCLCTSHIGDMHKTTVYYNLYIFSLCKTNTKVASNMMVRNITSKFECY